MNIIYKILAYLLSLPARYKGMQFGKNSFIGPGYDWLFVSLDGIRTGSQVMIGQNAWLQTAHHDINNAQIIIGDRTQIGRGFTASAIKKITVGKRCLISYHVSIFDHDHKIFDIKTSPINSDFGKPEEVVIEQDCFIGAHSFILKGVHLGKHCIVAANSVVTKSFPAFSVIGGNPAKLIRALK